MKRRLIWLAACAANGGGYFVADLMMGAHAYVGAGGPVISLQAKPRARAIVTPSSRHG